MRRKGFTLVELLVVISIIALLVAMLLPALQQARDKAIQVICEGRHKQLILAINNYANDFQTYVPGGGADAAAASAAGNFLADPAYGLVYRAPQYAGYAWNNPLYPQQELADYMDPRSPGWMCPGVGIDDPYSYPSTYSSQGSPSAPAGGSVPWTQGNIGAGYDYRPWMRKICQWGGWQTYTMRLDGPRTPSAADLFMCMPWQNNAAVPTSCNNGPHATGTRWFLSYLDGSVRGSGGYLDDPVFDAFLLVNCPPHAVWANWSN